MLTSVTRSEIRLTLEAAVTLHNQLRGGECHVRSALLERGFSRADRASDAAVGRLERRVAEMDELLHALPDLAVDDAVSGVNELLTELTITPAVTTHDGVGHHMHWAAPTARFDDQVMADICMALAHELCDEGVARFGRCGASDCDDLFYDATRNRSRRFCDDPRCANRTHTADHRARRRRSAG